MPDYVNVPELAYDWKVVAYFFLGGLSAGAYLFSVAANFWKKDLRPLATAPAILAPVALAIGMLLLLADLGQPARAWRLMLTFNPTSLVSWGTWFLNIFMLVSLIYAVTLFKAGVEKAKFIGYIGVPFALLVAAYTGMLLNQAPDKPLWNTALLPVLFVNGGLISGMAVALLASGNRGEELLAKVGRYLAWLVLAELVLVLFEVVVMFSHGGDDAMVAAALFTSGFALLFIGLEIVLGAAIPIFLLLRSKAPAARAIASVLILIGVFAMRYVVVIGGQVIK